MPADEPKLPPEIMNKLLRKKEPMIAALQGPGPFQLPLLPRVESSLVLESGHLEIRLETESAQEVRIVLTREAAAILKSMLAAALAKN